jgi:hypothetical protein
MASDELLNCPLCQGHGRISRAEVLAALTDRNLRDKVEKYVAEITSAEGALAGVGTKGAGEQDFEKQVHTWNPQLPIWRRSPKE